MQYYSDELFDHDGKSLGWFVFYPNGDVFSCHDTQALASNVVGSLNRGEKLQPPAAGEAHKTYELFDADGSIGTASFDAFGNFVPGSYRKTAAMDAKTSTPPF